MGSTIYFEVFVLVNILVSYVLRDDIVRHVARTTTEVPSRPQVASPKLLLQVRKLSEKVVRRTALQPLHQPTDRHLRRQRDQTDARGPSIHALS